MTNATSETPDAKAAPTPRKSGLGPVTVLLALLKRPLLVVGGALLCGLALLIGQAVRAEQLFDLASYAPILGGAWAVWASSNHAEGSQRGQLPSLDRCLRFGSTALVVLVLSGVAGLVIPVVGRVLVKMALSLGPTVALADLAWPPVALWRGLLVIDERPKDFAKLAAVSVLVLLLAFLLVPFALSVSLGIQSAGGGFVGGLARGLGWALISGLWMAFYLRTKEAPAAPANATPS